MRAPRPRARPPVAAAAAAAPFGNCRAKEALELLEACFARATVPAVVARRREVAGGAVVAEGALTEGSPEGGGMAEVYAGDGPPGSAEVGASAHWHTKFVWKCLT